MTDHKTRFHSLLSPSGAHRWSVCTPSALLERQFPDTASDAAAEGTLAHELAELKLRHYVFTVDFGKRKFTAEVNRLKKNPLWQDEMRGYTDEYLDYVKGIALSFPTTPTVAIEKRFSLDKYIPHLPDEPEASGSADCIILSGGDLHVFDFKYGWNVLIDAKDNPQLMLYALGAYGLYGLLYSVDTVHMHIVQPRIRNIQEWSCSIEELLKFGDWIKTRAELAVKGEGEFFPSESVCRFCRARAKCRARADANVKLAFEAGKKPPLITNEEMGEYLKQGQDVAKWLEDLKGAALAECLAGRPVPGWKAVEGRGSREWTDLDTAFKSLEASGIDGALLWERKPATVAGLEKSIGKKLFSEVAGELVTKKPGKPALVPESDKREAITNVPSVEEAFGKET